MAPYQQIPNFAVELAPFGRWVTSHTLVTKCALTIIQVLGIVYVTTRKLLVILSGLIWFISSSSSASDNISGMWSSQSRTKGGLGSQWTLAVDGNATYTFGALVDFSYVVKGNRVTMTLLDSGLVTKNVSVDEYKVEGDTLTINPNDSNKKQIMKRIGRQYPNTNPLIGEWTYKHYSGGPAYMRYSRAGVVELSVPFQSFSGKYRVSEDSINFELQGQKPISNKFHHENMSLIMTGSDGVNFRHHGAISFPA